jgi:hypothetical protein
VAKPIRTATKKRDFNPHAFLSTVGRGRDTVSLEKKGSIFTQGDATDGLFFHPNGEDTAQRRLFAVG